MDKSLGDTIMLDFSGVEVGEKTTGTLRDAAVHLIKSNPGHICYFLL